MEVTHTEDTAVKSRWNALGFFALAASLAISTSAPAQEARDIKAELGFEPVSESPRPPELPPPLPAKVITGIPVVDKKDLIVPAPVIVSTDSAPYDPFRGRVTVRADFGDGVGYTRGFAFLEAMLPIRQDAQSILFADLRIVNFDHEDRWEYNLGGGYRWYSPRIDHVLGVNAFYDARKSDFNYYQQLGGGVEVLGRKWEFRSNGYLVVGAAHRVVSDTGVVSLGTIVSNNFVFQRVQTVEAALGGVDVEIGCRIPFLDRWAVRGYTGFYSYSAAQIGVANGVRGRLEAQLTERISLHLQGQRDQLFHTTVSGGLAIHFGAAPYRRGRGAPTWDDVLRQPIHRDPNIVIATTTTTGTSFEPVPPPPPPPPSEEPEPEGRLID